MRGSSLKPSGEDVAKKGRCMKIKIRPLLLDSMVSAYEFQNYRSHLVTIRLPCQGQDNMPGMQRERWKEHET